MADQNQRKPIDKGIAANLWNALKGAITIAFRPNVVRHAKSDFLGYARLDIDLGSILPGFKFALPNLEVKVLSGGPYLGLPTELNTETGKRYPDFWFGTAELRRVLTDLVFSSQPVKEALAKCATMAKPGAVPTQQAAANVTDNPYA